MWRRFLVIGTLLAGIGNLFQMETLAAKFNRKVDIGDPTPVWNQLPGTDERSCEPAPRLHLSWEPALPAMATALLKRRCQSRGVEDSESGSREARLII